MGTALVLSCLKLLNKNKILILYSSWKIFVLFVYVASPRENSKTVFVSQANWVCSLNL